MAYKTRQELLDEIEELQNRLDNRPNEEKYDESAIELRNMYKAFKRAGFDDSQAWDLTFAIVKNGTQKRSLF